VLPGAKLVLRDAVMRFGTIALTPAVVVAHCGAVQSLANVYLMKKVSEHKVRGCE
jgi:hypothetical protein